MTNSYWVYPDIRYLLTGLRSNGLRKEEMESYGIKACAVFILHFNTKKSNEIQAIFKINAMFMP